MIKIAFKQFIHDHIWFGRAWTNLCLSHWNYKSKCDACNIGEWVDVTKPIEHIYDGDTVSPSWRLLTFMYVAQHRFGQYRIIKVNKTVPDWFIEND